MTKYHPAHYAAAADGYGRSIRIHLDKATHLARFMNDSRATHNSRRMCSFIFILLHNNINCVIAKVLHEIILLTRIATQRFKTPCTYGTDIMLCGVFSSFLLPICDLYNAHAT